MAVANVQWVRLSLVCEQRKILYPQIKREEKKTQPQTQQTICFGFY